MAAEQLPIKCRRCKLLTPAKQVTSYGECPACATLRLDKMRDNVAAQPYVDIKKGDVIHIAIPGLGNHKGKVIHADNFGSMAGWYVEFTNEKGQYAFWKQGEDGGIVTVVKKG